MNPSPQQCRSKLGRSGNNRKLTHVHVVQRCAFFIVWMPKSSGPLTPLTNTYSKFEIVSAKTTSWRCNSDSLANVAKPPDFFFHWTPKATCQLIPIQRVNGSVKLANRCEPLTTSQLMAFASNCTWTQPVGRETLTTCRKCLHPIVCETELCHTAAFTQTTAKSVKSLLFRHWPLFLLENPTTVVLSPLQRHIGSNLTAKRSSRPLDKSTSCIIIGPSNGRNVCELPSVPKKKQKRERRPYRPDRRLGFSFRAQWFTLAPLAYKGRCWNYHVFGTFSSGLKFNTFSTLSGSFLATFFCCAVSSCVYDRNHPYRVSERLFLADNKAFPYPRRAGAILWDAAATWPVVIFVAVAPKQRSPNWACVVVNSLWTGQANTGLHWTGTAASFFGWFSNPKCRWKDLFLL